MKIVGTRDGLATPNEVRQNASKLPGHTRWIWIDGGNHCQFGWYGFQPGDRFATIDASRQRHVMVDAMLELMRDVERDGQPPLVGDDRRGIPFRGRAPADIGL